MKQDIQKIEDIKLLVDSFYARIQKHELLAPIFASKIQDWTPHLEKMYRFWGTILVAEQNYFGSPFPPHAQLPVAKEHFDEWLKLWKATIDDHFEGEKANEAYWRAEKMAVLFHHKIEYYKAQGSTPLI